MRTAYHFLALAFVASAAVANAQQPAPQAGDQPRQGPPPRSRAGTPGRRQLAPPPAGSVAGRMGPGMFGGPMAGSGVASMLLAHTAELKLTDQQLSKLAAIARRTDDRHKAQRASMDSVMRANRPQPGATAPANPRTFNADQGRAMMDRMRDQERTDLRDALGVLTVDQQADAWMMRGAGMRGAGMRGAGMRGAGGPSRARFGAMRGRAGE